MRARRQTGFPSPSRMDLRAAFRVSAEEWVRVVILRPHESQAGARPAVVEEAELYGGANPQ